MHRSFNEIMEVAFNNSLAYIPIFIQKREEEKKLKKYAYKKNLKSRKGKK